MVELVLEKTDERLSADAMVEALEPMLDAEAEPFVLDLWRVILKETRGIAMPLRLPLHLGVHGRRHLR